LPLRLTSPTKWRPKMSTAELNFDPLEIVRYVDGPKVFGLKPSALKAKIDAGEIEAPIPLSHSGRALGWTRQMVMNHHSRMAALAEERRKAAKPKVKQPQPKALADVQKVKKIKLRRPGNPRQHESAA
jgi:hypothetical protein